MTAKITTMNQTLETSNQTLDRIIAREVMKESGNIVPLKLLS